ncbi:MAG: shikimate kinase, partial [Oscillospiraceae bacterium]|nr:shikimate kinase [Oscillospiraceae bacterium]
MLRCGLLGEKLRHSYSPAIHARLGDYAYTLMEKDPADVGAFLQSGSFDGINVTIPYKKTVMAYCAELSDTARAIGAVNTVVRRADGTLYGDNTDAYGFSCMVKSAGISVDGAKALVLGSGGASATVCAVLKEMGARDVRVISRSGEDNYDNLSRHADAEIIVNTTPVGMYPHNGASPVDLADFPACRGVLDVVYNPRRTALCLQAEARGILWESGLTMLVAQAKRASELFTGEKIDDACIESIAKELHLQMENIILVGMPGSGKSSVAAVLGEKLSRKVVDSDAKIVRRAGKSIPEIFAESGEEVFRQLESEVLRDLGKESGLIIATGGGVVTREENYAPLHQNGTLFHLHRDLEALPTDG